MKKWMVLTGLCILMAGCAAFGSKTLYRTDNALVAHNIGYCDLRGKDTLSQIFPQTCEVFYSTMDECADKYGLPMLVRIEPMIPENADSIAAICEKYDLDAFLFTELSFMKVTYTAFFIPVVSNLDTEVEMRLYDRKGNMSCATKHNTLSGNSYMFNPKTKVTVHDGVAGAFRKMAKENNWKPGKMKERQ